MFRVSPPYVSSRCPLSLSSPHGLVCVLVFPVLFWQSPVLCSVLLPLASLGLFITAMFPMCFHFPRHPMCIYCVSFPSFIVRLFVSLPHLLFFPCYLCVALSLVSPSLDQLLAFFLSPCVVYAWVLTSHTICRLLTLHSCGLIYVRQSAHGEVKCNS